MGTLIHWSESLAVGVADVDMQHALLVSLLNELHECVHRRRGAEACLDALERMRRCAITHFDVEQRLMREAGHENFSDNMPEQAQFLDELEKMIARVDEDNSNITFHGLHQLKVRLLRHVRGEDRAVEAPVDEERTVLNMRTLAGMLKRA